ncbi:MAG: PD-(D/E)XK nuclease family protein [Altibacter sp.]|nr:PD-(D/E)XK nuclease family protein [Altibacter sp.]
MQTFLEETLDTLIEKHEDLAALTLILPSKRAGGFLKNYLRKKIRTTTFAPTIISIEEFIETLSDVKIVDSTELLFRSFEAYLSIDTASEKENFESYSSWATTLLNDFNEIDRYLVDPAPFFSYLGSIKSLEKWNVDKEKTPLIDAYLKFWEQLPYFYESLTQQLLKDGIGYQGLVYRKAAEDIEFYLSKHASKPHIFIGFNALNTAEQQIIQALLTQGPSEIYWDADVVFMNDKKHSASLFLRRYKSSWNYFKTNEFTSIQDNFTSPKHIHIVEAQKNIGQVKYVASILKDFSEEELSKTAIVLADESLLLPLLHSLPASVPSINVTMGAPLRSFPAALFFDSLLLLHTKSLDTLYYKDVVNLIQDPLVSKLISGSREIIEQIVQSNLTHFSLQRLKSFAHEEDRAFLDWLFGDWKNESRRAIDACLSLINGLKDAENTNRLDRIVLFHIHTIFTKISALNKAFPHLKSCKTVHRLFNELIATTSLDFEGDAYSGLQVMGVLETRVLDFERVIMLSVNEGIIPSGKSNASFITYDLKKQFNLPLYTEKDAIYTYHFYRLLHRAQHITLLYNSFSDGLSLGEKSRFLLQLDIEKQPQHTITKSSISPVVKTTPRSLISIAKTPEVIERIRAIAAKGFSPSALAAYVRNPLDFYYQKVLKVNEFQEIEETVASNTLGTIVHDTLQELYSPLIGQLLTIEHLTEAKEKIDAEVRLQFKKTFKEGDFSSGKNLIVFEVAKRYIHNFISLEISEIKNGHHIKLIAVENDLNVPITIPGLEFPIHIGGKVDRVDEYDGRLRIVDYKTGLVRQGELEVVDWEAITTDYKYSKALQVLSYALMLNDENPITKGTAGIISFKNLGSGFLPFATKPSPRSQQKDFLITQEVLQSFTQELNKLIFEICDPNIPFTEKEIDSYAY